MKSVLFLRVMAVLLALLVFTGASGITLNAHWCNTNQTLEKSILPFPIDCAHAEHQADASCTTDTTSCCHSKVVVVQETKQSCCEDFLQYLKGLSDLELPKIKVKSLFNHFLVFMVRVMDFLSPTSKKPEPTAHFHEDAGPPPVSGKFLTIIHHQLKLDGQLS